MLDVVTSSASERIASLSGLFREIHAPTPPHRSPTLLSIQRPHGRTPMSVASPTGLGVPWKKKDGGAAVFEIPDSAWLKDDDFVDASMAPIAHAKPLIDPYDATVYKALGMTHGRLNMATRLLLARANPVMSRREWAQSCPFERPTKKQRRVDEWSGNGADRQRTSSMSSRSSSSRATTTEANTAGKSGSYDEGSFVRGGGDLAFEFLGGSFQLPQHSTQKSGGSLIYPTIFDNGDGDGDGASASDSSSEPASPRQLESLESLLFAC